MSRSCRNCGRPIGSRSGQARHCSDACRQAYADAAKKQRRVIAPCRICGAPPETRHSRYCSAHKPYQTEYQRRRRANGGRPLQVVSTRSCARCGVEFASPVHDKRYCSRRCQQAALRGWISYRRFPKIRAAERRVICKRDRWRCGICHAVIDPALRFPHPGSASIDHVDPFGPHEPSNWQAAHLACNVQAGRKGRKAAA